MAYKRIRVWDGTQWQQVGSQVPSIFSATGSGTIALVNGAAEVALSFDSQFALAPLVFVQVTGTNHATIAVDADTVGFTATIKGTGTDTITFNWFAVQAN